MKLSPQALFVAAGVLLAASACTSKTATNTNDNYTGNPQPKNASQVERGVMSGMARVPRGLRCRDQVVWVNMSSRAYHEEGDPYYGRTRNGQYMCMAAANGQGYHLAGARHGGSMGHGRNGAMGDQNNGSYPSTRGRHRQRGTTYGPEPTPTP